MKLPEQDVLPETGQHRSLTLMLEDASLPDDVVPAAPHHTQVSTALVTGASGFLGRYVVRTLLRETDLHLHCLVRDGEGVSAEARLLSALDDIDVEPALVEARVSVVVGDISMERFGLTDSEYQALTQSTGRVYHCAARVNWARNYRQLREVNVFGALEVIRFASLNSRKPIVFVSTIAACFATGHRDEVTEATDMLPYVQRMPLGYAQSKCVAESLMKQACARGLPVTIVRPSLISGDSQTGKANIDDLIAALIEGCARARVCGDSEWLLDCVPVDLVADAIARVPVPELVFPVDSGPEPLRPVILHLVHDRPCHWSEAVAGLGAFGCPVELVSIEQWVEAVFADRNAASVRLYGYRRFFKGFAGLPAPFESYLKRHQLRINSNNSYRMLQSMGLSIPELDQSLLYRYLQFYQQNGLLPGTGLAARLA